MEADNDGKEAETKGWESTDPQVDEVNADKGKTAGDTTGGFLKMSLSQTDFGLDVEVPTEAKGAAVEHPKDEEAGIIKPGCE